MKVLFLSSAAHDQSFGKVLEDLLVQGDEDILAYNHQCILHTVSRKGHPQMPIARALKHIDENLCELRLKYDKTNLFRPYYFVDKENDTLIILNGIIKPDGSKKSSRYEGASRHKIDRLIDESIKQAKILKTNYLTNQHDYQEYPL